MSRLPFFDTKLYELSPLEDLKLFFNPIYDNKGQLISIQNFPCLKRTCFNEKEHLKNNKGLPYNNRVVLLHKNLRSKFCISDELLNDQVFPLAICPTHLEPSVNQEIEKTGQFPLTYSSCKLNDTCIENGSIAVKSNKTLLRYSRILQRLIDNPSIETQTADTNLDIFSLATELIFTPPDLQLQSGTSTDTPATTLSTVDESFPNYFLFEHEGVVIPVTPGSYNTSQPLQPSQPSQPSQLSSFQDILASIENNTENQSEVQRCHNIFSYFNCEEKIKKASCKSELDLILLPIFYENVENSLNLGYLYENTIIQEDCGTFGICRITSTQPLNLINKSRFCSSLLLEAELLLNSQNINLFFLPNSISLENEFVYRSFCLKSSRLSLNKICQKIGLIESQCSFVISEIIKGLGYLHSHNIIFNNLEPNNVFICKNFVQIGNFIYSCKENCVPYEPCNLPFPYQSPEKSQQLPYFCNSDIWSLGILFVFLLTSNPKCFFMTDSYDSLELHQTVNLPNNQNYEFSIIKFSFISLCLTKNLNRRPTIEYFKNHPAINDQQWL